MTRKLVTIALSVAAFWLLTAVAAPQSLGQDTAPLFPPLQVPGPSRAFPSVDSSAPVAVPLTVAPRERPSHGHQATACACQEDHWLVSIRHCKQHCRQCVQCCDLDYFRADAECCTSRIGASEFVGSLRPGVPVCIVVHGSYVTREALKEDCRHTFRWLRHAAPQLPLHIVIFSWPSEGPLTIDPNNALSSLLPQVDVGILGRRAENNGVRLAALLNEIPAENPICLIGHSHGARMIASSLHLLGGGRLGELRLKPGPSHRIRTVLAAATIDHNWLAPGERYGRALCATECLLSLKSRHDWALFFYPLRKPFSPGSLGRTGFTNRDLRELGEQRAQVSEVDVTRFVGIGHIWPHYYDRPEIAQLMIPFVYFTDWNQ